MEVARAWDAALQELRVIRKRHGIPNVPTPDPPDLDDNVDAPNKMNGVASGHDTVDGVSTDSGSSFQDGSNIDDDDDDDDEYNNECTPRAGKQK